MLFLQVPIDMVPEGRPYLVAYPIYRLEILLQSRLPLACHIHVAQSLITLRTSRRIRLALQRRYLLVYPPYLARQHPTYLTPFVRYRLRYVHLMISNCIIERHSVGCRKLDASLGVCGLLHHVCTALRLDGERRVRQLAVAGDLVASRRRDRRDREDEATDGGAHGT
ncbi:MAG: hypothetical protein FWD69_01285 [Polyangiaceae bacterium]|nr:hypothetical protein [Polyangiaceae bacterium]